jgi:cell wall-associated NlpC family hydrolase
VLFAVGGSAVVVHQLGRSSQAPLVGSADAAGPAGEAGPAGAPKKLSFTRLAKPARTVVTDPRGATVAVFTDGARTVRLRGPSRTLREPKYTEAVVTTDAWVRLAPKEWRKGAEQATWFGPWLTKALADRSPDVLAIATEYIHGAKPRLDEQGRQIAGDAAFGPLSDIDPDGRAENSDFYDYLGERWTFPTDGRKERPDAARARSLDCSGYLRMVYGYRLGYPLRGTNTKGTGLPRRAYAMAEFGPGVQLVSNTGERARDYDLLQPGDLLFFNAGPVQNAHIEHSGMYLGVDSDGHHRFISSRATANGPTMGDLGGASLLDGSGYWAVRYRTARRI